ncbi:MAG: hypothetical protein K8S87_10270 [Planctomycetes bacterium]|nr:hypothetical protein [Planctomycetota bacterium]
MSEALLLQVPNITEITVNPFQMTGPIEYAYPDVERYIRKSLQNQEEEKVIKTKAIFQIAEKDVELAIIGKWALIIWGFELLTDFEKLVIKKSINLELFEDKQVWTNSELILGLILTEVKRYENDDDFNAKVLKHSVKSVLNKINMPANITKSSFIINNGEISYAFSGLQQAYFGILDVMPRHKIVTPKSSSRIFSKHNPLKGIVVCNFDTVAGKRISRIDTGKVLTIEKNFTLQVESF